MSNKFQYVQDNWEYAYNAGRKYAINPVVILAQGAVESAWGASYGARVRKNYFGITAYGSPNEYWNGSKSASTVNPHLEFRVYRTPQDSFNDFARLIRSKYQNAAVSSYQVPMYAQIISNSSYINEGNGDNRTNYRNLIVSAANYIAQELKNVSVPSKRTMLTTLLSTAGFGITAYGFYQLIKMQNQNV